MTIRAVPFNQIFDGPDIESYEGKFNRVDRWCREQGYTLVTIIYEKPFYQIVVYRDNNEIDDQ